MKEMNEQKVLNQFYKNDKNKLDKNRKDSENRCNRNNNCSGNSGSPELYAHLVV
jgi:hypothetical protein